MAAVPLHVSDEGKGPPILLLHGFPFDHTIWAEVRQGLKGYRTIAPDMRGHGQSPTPAGPWTIRDLADDAIALLDRLRIDRAYWLGHSIGGYIALAAYRMAPGRFQGIGLIASQAEADSEEARGNRAKLAAKVQAEGSRAAADAMLPKLFSPDLPESDPNRARIRVIIEATSPNAIAATLGALASRDDQTDLLPRIETPLLVAAGEKDAIIPLAKAEAVAQKCPRGTLVALKAGHMPMLEDPAGLEQAIRTFLK